MTTAVAPPVESSLSRGRLVGRRVVAAAVDLVLVPNLLVLLGQAAGGDAGSALAWLVALAAVVVGQGRFGASLGMAIVGLVVVGESARLPGVARSAARHGWVLIGFVVSVLLMLLSVTVDGGLGGAAFLVIGVAASGAALAVPLALLGSIWTSDDARGLHDRWSGLRVLPTEAPPRRIPTLVLLVVVWGLLQVAVPLVGDPEQVVTERIGDATTTVATCDVSSRFLVGDEVEQRVELSRGMDLVEVRHGSHLVRFDDEPFERERRFGSDDRDAPGLHYEVRANGAGGASSSGSSGPDGHFRDIEVSTAGGGRLHVRCTAPGSGDAAAPPATAPSDTPAVINPTAVPPNG